MNLELYFSPGACSFVAHFALEAIQQASGQSFEPRLVKIHKGEQFAPEFLALNTNAQVPVLVVDGKPLTQIVAISIFLDQSFPQAKLLPTDIWARASALSTLTWFNNSVHPTFTHFFMPAKFATDETAQSLIKEKARVDYRKHMERLDGMVKNAGTPFLNGATPGVLDAYALTLYRWSGFAGIDPASLPALRDCVQPTAAAPAMAAAIARERIDLHTYKAA
jgi:glutathione S-transferase